MDEEDTTTATPGNGDQGGKRASSPATAKALADAASAARDAERARVREIEAIAVRIPGLDAALTRKAIDEGSSVEEFRKLVLDSMAKAGGFGLKPAERGDDEVGLNAGEIRSYSFLRALRVLAAPNDARVREEAKFELECSAATAKRLGQSPRGIFIPPDVTRAAGLVGGLPAELQQMVRNLNRFAIAHGRRDLVVGTATAGGNLVATDLLASSFIELLRNRLVLARAGATVLADLVGNVAIPAQTGAATAYWITEGNAPTESQQTIGQVALTPKTVGAFTDFSRQLLLQSSIDVEAFVRADLTRVLALAIDYAGFYGSGASGQPAGLSQIVGVGLTDFAGVLPTYAEIVDMETDVSVANADVETMAYIAAPGVRGHAKTTEKFSTTGQTIWEPGNMLNGYPALISNQITAAHVWFGNWADFLIGMWGGLDVMVDPYTHSTSGTMRVVALQSVDVDVRHPGSFDWGYQATP